MSRIGLKRGDRIVVSFSEEKRCEYEVRCESLDGSFIIVSEGEGLSGTIYNDAVLGSYTFDGFPVKVEKIQ